MHSGRRSLRTSNEVVLPQQSPCPRAACGLGPRTLAAVTPAPNFPGPFGIHGSEQMLDLSSPLLGAFRQILECGDYAVGTPELLSGPVVGAGWCPGDGPSCLMWGLSQGGTWTRDPAGSWAFKGSGFKSPEGFPMQLWDQ